MSDHSMKRRDAIARLTLGVAAAGMPWSAGQTQQPRSRGSMSNNIDAELTELLALANVPSLSIAQVNGDKITTKAIGLLKVGEAEHPNADTVYAAASLTKAVFTYTFLSFVQDGLLSLDKPVREYLPLPNPDDPRGASITAKHLLSHSSGWRNWRNNNATLLTADFEPGSRWSYSGEGFFFLQRVLEKLTGKAIGVLVRERVFAPLGMTRSSLAPLVELDANRAWAHDSRGQFTQGFGRPTMLELRRAMSESGRSVETASVEDAERAIKAAEPTLPALPNFLSPNAAASMLTTASDFAKFLKHFVTAKKQGGAAAAIVAQMMSPQIRCNDRVQWGLGVGLEDVGTNRCAWQWGDNPGYKNFFWADPAREQAMVVFTNGDRGARVYERAIRALTGTDHPGFLWI